MSTAQPSHASTRPAASRKPRVRLGALTGVVGFLAFVEVTSGIIQGYYVPMLTDIARHLSINDADVNWLEGAQLMLSALAVPALAKLGDMHGHKRILLWSTAVTAIASLALPFADSFPVFLAAWALQGLYSVWLPLEIAIIWSHSRDREGSSLLTARAAGILVAFLEGGGILGALAGGMLVDALPLRVVLLVPALFTVAGFPAVRFGVRESELRHGVRESELRHRRRLDRVGLVLVSLALIAFTGGMSLLRLNGPADPVSWAAVLLGIALIVPFARHELRHPNPLIDVRMFRSPALAPVFLAAGLCGVSLLGAQAPLSTFARTDPEVYGYGLGARGFATSLLMGFYLVAMLVGALLLPKAALRCTPRIALIGATVLVGIGYLLFVPFHDEYAQMAVNLAVAGLGSGALVAALPAAAATAAPPAQTGVATGLTSSVRTVGGAIASAVFGIALMHGVAGAAGTTTGSTAGSLTGYLTVWVICGVTALVAAVLLCFVPRDSFTDRPG